MASRSISRHRASYPYTAPKALRGPSSAVGLAGLFKQLDISHGGPGDERPEGVVFFGAFFFDCFYGDSAGVVVDQPGVEAAPSREPHGYSLSVPLLRQIPGHDRASPVRLGSPGILPLRDRGRASLGAVKRRQARYKPVLYEGAFLKSRPCLSDLASCSYLFIKFRGLSPGH